MPMQPPRARQRQPLPRAYGILLFAAFLAVWSYCLYEFITQLVEP